MNDATEGSYNEEKVAIGAGRSSTRWTSSSTSPARPACRCRTLGWRSSTSTPAVTAAIIGGAAKDELDDAIVSAGVRLDAATLDRIDEIVPPRCIFHERDRGPQSPDYLAKHLHRRSAGAVPGGGLNPDQTPAVRHQPTERG